MLGSISVASSTRATRGRRIAIGVQAFDVGVDPARPGEIERVAAARQRRRQREGEQLSSPCRLRAGRASSRSGPGRATPPRRPRSRAHGGRSAGSAAGPRSGSCRCRGSCARRGRERCAARTRPAPRPWARRRAWWRRRTAARRAPDRRGDEMSAAPSNRRRRDRTLTAPRAACSLAHPRASRRCRVGRSGPWSLEGSLRDSGSGRARPLMRRPGRRPYRRRRSSP